MDIVGIICEYDPFHNGHLYHLSKVKEMFPDSLIVLVMSGNFTQRGNVSILSKWEKTDIALENDIDIVCELPFKYTMQSADVFATGAIKILKEMGCNYLVFGSEEDDVEKLYKMAEVQLNNKYYDEKVKYYLDRGHNYPTAMALGLKDLTHNEIKEPNDLLGLSYIKAIIKEEADIKPVTIKRTNHFHDKNLSSNIVSAKAIREAIINKKDIKRYVPSSCYKYLKNKTHPDYFPFLKYKIMTDWALEDYVLVDEGIENRILKGINANSLDELIQIIKTKRYTYNKINRMLINILVSFKKDENDISLDYIHILGFNIRGKKYLKEIKKKIKLPLITNVTKDNAALLDLDIRADQVYALITNGDSNAYKNKPIIKR